MLPPVVNVRTVRPLRGSGDRRNYLRARLIARDGELFAEPMPSQGSGVSTSMVQANAFVILDIGTEHVDAGAVVPALIVGPVFSS